MKYSDIMEQYVYTVDFDTVRPPEFDRKHLAIVLKKNNDRKTLLVAPLTRESNGEGTNKYNIGKISTLPDNLKQDDSYVVYNQIRTVNYSRFYPLKDNQRNVISCKVDDNTFKKVFELCLDNISDAMSDESRYEYYKNKYIDLTMKQVINKAYEIKRNQEKINLLKTEITGLLNQEVAYNNYISSANITDEIEEIIKTCLITKK